jgi:hypothetical protein
VEHAEEVENRLDIRENRLDMQKWKIDRACEMATLHEMTGQGDRMTLKSMGESSGTSGPPGANPGQRSGGFRRRHTWQRLGIFLVAALGGILAAAGYTGALWYYFPRHDYDRWQGRWRIIVHDRATPHVVRVVGQHWEYEGAERERVYRLELDSQAEPRRLHLELLDTHGLQGPTPRMHGIYAFDSRHQVRVVLLPATEPLPDHWDQAEHVLTLIRD